MLAIPGNPTADLYKNALNSGLRKRPALASGDDQSAARSHWKRSQAGYRSSANASSSSEMFRAGTRSFGARTCGTLRKLNDPYMTGREELGRSFTGMNTAR